MKYVQNFILLVFMSLSLGLAAQVNEAVEDIATGPVMTFETLVVDYGDIVQHADPLRVVKFTNTGLEPLIIKNARGSCGCTVPIWPKEPIMPGESSQIEVRYDTKRVGPINKKVTITTNEGGEAHVLKVVGNIAKADDVQSVPAKKESIFNQKTKSKDN